MTQALKNLQARPGNLPVRLQAEEDRWASENRTTVLEDTQ